MGRSIHQYRPKGDPGGMIYAPQRDVANIYTPMLREVVMGLDEGNWPPKLKAIFEERGITQDDLSEAVAVFMRAHQLFIRDRTVDSPADAFERAGINDVHPLVHMAIFERLGEVMMGGFFVAIRDVTHQGAQSAIHTDFVDMLAAGRYLAEKLSDHRWDCEYDLAVETAQADAEETKRALDQAREGLEQATVDAYQASSEKQAVQQRLDKYRPVLEDVDKTRKLKWLPRLWVVIKLAARLYFRKAL